MGDEMNEKKNKLTIDISRELHLDLKVLAHTHNMSMRALIVMLVGEFARKMKSLEKGSKDE